MKPKILQLHGTRLTINRGLKTGKVALSTTEANKYIKANEPFFYVVQMTTNRDIPIMEKAEAVITMEGGPSCHAAIICRMKGLDVLLNCGGVITQSYLRYQGIAMKAGNMATLYEETFVIEDTL